MARSSERSEWDCAFGMLGLVALPLGLAGCTVEAKPVTAETSKYRPADQKSADSAPAATATAVPKPATDVAIPGSAAIPAAAAAGATPPTGELKQLLELIDKLARQQEMVQNFLRMQQQRMAACEQALLLKPDDDTRRGLLQAMYEIHTLYNRAEMPKARENFLAFAKKLAADTDPQTARFGRFTLFDIRISQ